MSLSDFQVLVLFRPLHKITKKILYEATQATFMLSYFVRTTWVP